MGCSARTASPVAWGLLCGVSTLVGDSVYSRKRVVCADQEAVSQAETGCSAGLATEHLWIQHSRSRRPRSSDSTSQ
jgi:hypothetical protein